MYPQHILEERAVSGDADALNSLLLQHYQRLRERLAQRVPANLQATVDVDDVIQITFADAFRNIGRYKPGGVQGFFNWLAAIGDNRLIDQIRAQQAAKRGGGFRRITHVQGAATGSLDSLVDLLGAETDSPSRHMARQDLIAALEVALEQLKEEYRAAIELRFGRGLPYAEIGKILGRSENAAAQLCQRALARLREELRSSTSSSRQA